MRGQDLSPWGLEEDAPGWHGQGAAPIYRCPAPTAAGEHLPAASRENPEPVWTRTGTYGHCQAPSAPGGYAERTVGVGAHPADPRHEERPCFPPCSDLCDAIHQSKEKSRCFSALCAYLGFSYLPLYLDLRSPNEHLN